MDEREPACQCHRIIGVVREALEEAERVVTMDYSDLDNTIAQAEKAASKYLSAFEGDSAKHFVIELYAMKRIAARLAALRETR